MGFDPTLRMTERRFATAPFYRFFLALWIDNFALIRNFLFTDGAEM